MSTRNETGRFDTVVIGAGQAGLAVGYYLAKQGRDFVVLDAGARVGDSWRKRWDSLRLFTTARYDGLPGMPFPAPPDACPTKDEMADYLEAYASRLGIPVQPGAAVEALVREGAGFVLRARGRRVEARHVVVATGGFQRPRVPPFASGLDPAIQQLHSSRYRNPGQLREGPVLVVGAGNSGAEIALELAASRPTWLSGHLTGRVPLSPTGRISEPVFWWLVHCVLTVDTPVGRWMRRRALSRGAPLIRVRAADLDAAGVQRAGRTIGVRAGRPVLEDGRVLDVANVVWCTGFAPDFSWIELPVFGEDGFPIHDRGVVRGAPGLYFVGLPFQYALSSATIGGVGRDAEYVVRAIACSGRGARAPAREGAPARDGTGARDGAPARDGSNRVSLIHPSIFQESHTAPGGRH